MRPLVEQGHVYIAQPPLFKISRGKKVRYAYSEPERDQYIKELYPEGNVKTDVQRYKAWARWTGTALGNHHGPGAPDFPEGGDGGTLPAPIRSLPS